MNIQTKPEPTCPDCGAKMRLRNPQPGQDWQPLWGCMAYPDCKGTRDILPDGTAEGEEVEAWVAWDFDA